MSEQLNHLFGPCLTANREVAEIEQIAETASRDALDGEAVSGLKQYLESAGHFKLVGAMHATTPILWLIDEDGVLHFGLEEVINVETGKVTFVLPRNSPKLRDGEARLGHPALLPKGDFASKKARIGGEIIFDPNFGPLGWVLTNNSGRYGKRPHIKEEHLENVQKRFADVGISLERFFYYTPTDVGAA